MARLAPSTSGPSVSTAQYTSTRWPSGRLAGVRQMALRVWSIVSTSDIAVNTSAPKPSVPSWLAWVANWVR